MSAHLRAAWGKLVEASDDDVWVVAAMNLVWGEDRDALLLNMVMSQENEGNYCLDHGFAKKVALEAEGFEVMVRLHHNYGRGCEECNERVDVRDDRVKEIDNWREWRQE